MKTHWLTLKEASSKYAVDEEEILRWTEIEEITSSCIGNTIIVDDDSIQAHLESNKVPARNILLELYRNSDQMCRIYEEIVGILERRLDRCEELNKRIIAKDLEFIDEMILLNQRTDANLCLLATDQNKGILDSFYGKLSKVLKALFRKNFRK